MIVIFHRIDSLQARLMLETHTAYPVVAFNMNSDEEEYEFFVKNGDKMLKITRDSALYSFTLLGGS